MPKPDIKHTALIKTIVLSRYRKATVTISKPDIGTYGVN